MRGLIDYDKRDFFAREATWGRILTLDQPKMRGMSLGNRCCMCKREEQFIDHFYIAYQQECCGNWFFLCSV